MPLDFPASPSSGDQTTLNNVTYEFDGSKWTTLSSLFSRGTFSAGNAPSPGFSVSGDPDTGFYSPGANSLGFSTGGTGRLVIDSSGNIGVGLTPFAKLHVGGTIQSSVGSHTAQMYSDGGAAFFTSVGAYPSVFYTNGSERMRITSSGNVGIRTSSPSYALDISSSDANAIRIRGTADTPLILDATDSGPSYVTVQRAGTRVAYYGFGGSGNDFNIFNDTSNGDITFGTNSTEVARITDAGRLGIGTTSPAQALHVVGEIVATDDITAFYSSDRRLKQDIEPIEDAVEKVKQISGVTYAWNDEYLKDKYIDGYFVRDREAGVIAQEIEEVLPEIVATRENGYKAVKYDRLVALLIEAVKEQQEQIDELKAKLEE